MYDESESSESEDEVSKAKKELKHLFKVSEELRAERHAEEKENSQQKPVHKKK